jgi:hypothetical protein
MIEDRLRRGVGSPAKTLPMKIYYFLELLIAAVFIVPDSRLAAAQTKAPQQVALLKIDKKY